MKIVTTGKFNWQYPVITEKFAFDLISDDKHLAQKDLIYIAYPWATIIDLYKKDQLKTQELKLLDFVENNVSHVSDYRNCSFTVCQTYQFKNFLPVFKNLGINMLFTPHATKSDYSEVKSEFAIEVLPFPLYAVNVPKMKETRKILYSFIGNIEYKGGDEISRERVTTLRNRLVYDVNHSSNTVIFPIKNWHFDEVVYKESIYGKTLSVLDKAKIDLRTKRFKSILADSRFALCPRGIGPNSIRFWEALGAGTIPISIADDLWLPMEDEIDWDKCIIKISEKDIEQIPDIIHSISFSLEAEMRENCLKAYKALSGENFIAPIREKLLNI